MEREEMKICVQKLMEIPSVIAVDETVINYRKNWNMGTRNEI
jgi:hypothetical protein